ncbi:WRKY DNA-binding protein 69 [Striga asiatica]|uniref:WRKY DNA-binding protein 69 n=1 Tax=Striga asiatica TaxID=4170 RepID=A0A5A7RH43_STRAF|nr:WRKY DNA-binding protein 69 [Striga asiatica]
MAMMKENTINSLSIRLLTGAGDIIGRCSSSKGCPARKQVERSRLDLTTLLISYACDHNHPNTTRNYHQQPPDIKPSSPLSEEFGSQPDIEPAFAELAGELGWLCHVGSTLMEGTTTLVGPMWAHTDVTHFVPIREEDKLLFRDLCDLADSAMLSRTT